MRDFYRSATMKKFSTVTACKRNGFDFWNSCKRLQNFVNVEALVLYRVKYSTIPFEAHRKNTDN